MPRRADQQGPSGKVAGVLGLSVFYFSPGDNDVAVVYKGKTFSSSILHLFFYFYSKCNATKEYVGGGGGGTQPYYIYIYTSLEPTSVLGLSL